ncbi:hypothetical protein M9H77_17460 [Catharanthus roseus]|uniref:Uncharacterized protein n=1 Tax=Catharanthus roseus TaxID=4058 RepID=A0ACC0B4N1_CATRO|nr:hypothetical protein M9H77_17460 [Catharanthus roseus]
MKFIKTENGQKLSKNCTKAEKQAETLSKNTPESKTKREGEEENIPSKGGIAKFRKLFLKSSIKQLKIPFQGMTKDCLLERRCSFTIQERSTSTHKGNIFRCDYDSSFSQFNLHKGVDKNKDGNTYEEKENEGDREDLEDEKKINKDRGDNLNKETEGQEDGEDIEKMGSEDETSDETASEDEEESSSKEYQEDEMKDDIMVVVEKYHTPTSSPPPPKEKRSSEH